MSLVLVIVCSMVSFWISCNYLVVKKYELSWEKISREIKLVVLADLHDHEFGTNNEKLIEKIAEHHPDLILLDGDFLNEDSENVGIKQSYFLLRYKEQLLKRFQNQLKNL